MTKTIVVVFIVFANLIYAQSPNWTVEENNFEHAMTLVGFLTVDNNRLSNINDKVAAFVDDEIRGVTNLIYVESQEAYFAYLTIFANQNGETIRFKIYDSQNNTVVDVNTTLDFEILAHTGNLLQAFSIASPELSNEVEVIDLSFQEVQTLNFSQENDVINLDVINSENLGISTLEFQLSSGADMIFNNEILSSGSSRLDITNTPIELQIRSQDQSVLRDVTLQVNFEDQPRFFRRNEICHTLGAIKVMYTSDETRVILKQGNTTIAERIINNSEVIFDNLQAGDYQIVLGASITKNIMINYVQ